MFALDLCVMPNVCGYLGLQAYCILMASEFYYLHQLSFFYHAFLLYTLCSMYSCVSVWFWLPGKIPALRTGTIVWCARVVRIYHTNMQTASCFHPDGLLFHEHSYIMKKHCVYERFEIKVSTDQFLGLYCFTWCCRTNGIKHHILTAKLLVKLEKRPFPARIIAWQPPTPQLRSIWPRRVRVARMGASR